jgi:hypothetical protein
MEPEKTKSPVVTGGASWRMLLAENLAYARPQRLSHAGMRMMMHRNLEGREGLHGW